MTSFQTEIIKFRQLAVQWYEKHNKLLYFDLSQMFYDRNLVLLCGTSMLQPHKLHLRGVGFGLHWLDLNMKLNEIAKTYKRIINRKTYQMFFSIEIFDQNKKIFFNTFLCILSKNWFKKRFDNLTMSSSDTQLWLEKAVICFSPFQAWDLYDQPIFVLHFTSNSLELWGPDKGPVGVPIQLLWNCFVPYMPIYPYKQQT